MFQCSCVGGVFLVIKYAIKYLPRFVITHNVKFELNDIMHKYVAYTKNDILKAEKIGRPYIFQ